MIPIACYMISMSGDHKHVLGSEANLKRPPWQPSWMSQGHEFQLDTTTGQTKYIALGFVSASVAGLEE